jgi:hypothetical protein
MSEDDAINNNEVDEQPVADVQVSFNSFIASCFFDDDDYRLFSFFS